VSGVTEPKRRDSTSSRSSTASIDPRLAEAEALFASIGEGAIVTDINGRISKINKRAVDALGYTMEEVQGKWFPSVFRAEDEQGRPIPNNRRPIFEVFLKGEAVFRRMHYIRKDGSRIAAAVTVSPVFLDGEPIGAIEVFRDITEELRLERSKDDFIALASHQLRTPATGVKQYAAMLLEGYAGELTEQQRSMLTKIYESNERQIITINDLLRVAQLDAGRVKLGVAKVDLKELAEDVLSEQMHKFVNRSQEVHLDLPKEAVWVSVDEDRFRMVVENLIDNASKYTPEGKDVYISVKSDSGIKRLSIKDEGVGIPESEFQRIFEKFCRLDNPLSVSVGGTGLGLYWVQKILDLHDADIQVSSELGKGTTFTIIFPD